MTDTPRDQIRALCRTNLWAFNSLMIGNVVPEYEYYLYVDLMAQYIEDAMLGRTDGKLVINLPPRHLKSYTAVSAIAWYLGQFPDREVMLVTHSQSLSRYLASRCLDMIRSKEYAEIFPGLRLSHDKQSTRDFGTTAGGGLLSGSFETRISGRGAALLFIDDALSAQEAESQASRESVINTYDSLLATRQNSPSRHTVISISHRVHPADLSDHLLQKGFEHLKLAFKAEETEDIRRGEIRFHRKEGEVLQPSRYPPNIIAKEIASLAPHVYSTQYQQRPTARESGVLRAAYFPLEESLPSGGETIFSWDCASSTKPGSSYSVCLVFQRHGAVSYLKHISRTRLDFLSLSAQAIALDERYQPKRHLVEAASNGTALMGILKQNGANVLPVTTGLSKEQRLDAVIGKITAQYVHIVRGIPGIDEFLDELTAFPYGSNDDQVDALTQYLQSLDSATPKGLTNPLMLRVMPRKSRIDRYRPKT